LSNIENKIEKVSETGIERKSEGERERERTRERKKKGRLRLREH
jgi:hypothetical protein